MASLAEPSAGSSSAQAAAQHFPTNPPPDSNYYLTHGLDQAVHHTYRNTRSFRNAIDAQTNQLRSASENTAQYVVFNSVTEKKFATIDCIRDREYKGLRFMYLPDQETLIAKVPPGVIPDRAVREFAYSVRTKAAGMGLVEFLADIGGTTFDGIRGKKEADTGLKPLPGRCRSEDWPTIVFESGLSQSLERLQVDCRWWFENSNGAVKIAILFAISKAKREIHIEQWEIPTEPARRVTRSNPGSSAPRPAITCQLDIAPGVPFGNSLKLDFDQVFLRRPGEGEANINFTEQDLKEFATHFWCTSGLQYELD